MSGIVTYRYGSRAELLAKKQLRAVRLNDDKKKSVHTVVLSEQSACTNKAKRIALSRQQSSRHERERTDTMREAKLPRRERPQHEQSRQN
jgi:hypothetical protein